MAYAILLKKSLSGYFFGIVVDFTGLLSDVFSKGGQQRCYY